MHVVNTFARDVYTVTLRQTFYNIISQNVRESATRRYESRCQKKVKTMY